jgi:hypothetical protein
LIINKQKGRFLQILPQGFILSSYVNYNNILTKT